MYENIKRRLKNNISLYAGYPPNTEFDYSELAWALEYPMNNIGDPFDMKSGMSSQEYECAVIRWFLNIFGSNIDESWGYTTTGGTEGILFGMWKARDAFPNAIAYMSEYAHYGIHKSADILGIPYKLIKSTESGEMDYEDLTNKLDNKKPAIIVATLGSIMTSSKDNIEKILSILSSANIPRYIHADAAFDGMILPFIDTPLFYRLDQGIDSISISGHKLIGSPIPCGIVLIKQKHIENNSHISYIYNFDCTISGSRSSLAPLVMWSAIKKHGAIGFKNFVHECLSKSKKYCQLFNDYNIPAWQLSNAMTIVLEKQPDIFLKKWRAPSNEKFTTLMALPKLTDNMVQEIIADIHSIKNTGNLSQNKEYLMPQYADDILL